jgi:hypothetical protein
MQDVNGDNHDEGPSQEVVTESCTRVAADLLIETPKSKKRKVRRYCFLNFLCFVLSHCLFRYEHMVV